MKVSLSYAKVVKLRSASICELVNSIIIINSDVVNPQFLLWKFIEPKFVTGSLLNGSASVRKVSSIQFDSLNFGKSKLIIRSAVKAKLSD